MSTKSYASYHAACHVLVCHLLPLRVWSLAFCIALNLTSLDYYFGFLHKTITGLWFWTTYRFMCKTITWLCLWTIDSYVTYFLEKWTFEIVLCAVVVYTIEDTNNMYSRRIYPKTNRRLQCIYKSMLSWR